MFPDSFNLLSVYVQNNALDPFEGNLVLRRTRGVGGAIGADIVEQVFVAPGTGRWVQFYPYLMEMYDEWTLIWGFGANERMLLQLPRTAQTQPTVQQPVHVLVVEQAGTLTPKTDLPQFPDELFPTVVGGTEHLETVVLAHVPRWEEPRQQAFLDWLRLGGRLHLLHDRSGKYPEFPAMLAELNHPLDDFRVGAGRVTRHARTVAGLEKEFLATQFGGVPPEQVVPQANVNQWQNPYGSFTQNAFQNLKEMTNPNHNWGIIYLMSVVYLGVLFPGLYVLSQRRRDYKVVYGALLAAVVMFSFGFDTVGQRGYGEATTVHSLAVARQIDDGLYSVGGWTNVFVTRGDDYELTFGGDGHLFSTCQQFERVNGRIDNGLQGLFEVDIPPYSSRSFAYRMRTEAPKLGLRVAEWTSAKMEFEIGPEFPRETTQIMAVLSEYSYPVAIRGNRLIVQAGRGSLLRESRWDENPWQANQYGWQAHSAAKETREQRYGRAYGPLIADILGASPQRPLTEFAGGGLRLFIYAPMPEQFWVDNPQLGKQHGYVMYVVDLFPPEDA